MEGNNNEARHKFWKTPLFTFGIVMLWIRSPNSFSPQRASLYRWANPISQAGLLYRAGSESLLCLYLRRAILVRAKGSWGEAGQPAFSAQKLAHWSFLVGFDLLAWTNLLNFLASDIWCPLFIGCSLTCSIKNSFSSDRSDWTVIKQQIRADENQSGYRVCYWHNYKNNSVMFIVSFFISPTCIGLWIARHIGKRCRQRILYQKTLNI